MIRSRVPFIVPNPCLVIGLKGVGEGYVARRLVPRQGPSVPQDATLSLDTAQTHTGPARHSRGPSSFRPGSSFENAPTRCGPISSFVRKCAYAAFVEPLHSAISSFRPPNSSFPRRRESRGEVRVVAMTLELSHQPAPQFSYLGVPAPAGMGDWYESMSRTPIRDVPSNQPRCRLSTGEPSRIVDQWSMAE